MAGHNITVSWSVFKFMCMWSTDERFRMDKEESSQKPVSGRPISHSLFDFYNNIKFEKVINSHCVITFVTFTVHLTSIILDLQRGVHGRKSVCAILQFAYRLLCKSKNSRVFCRELNFVRQQISPLFIMLKIQRAQMVISPKVIILQRLRIPHQLFQ